MRISAKVPPPLTWHICRIIVDSFGPIVSACILHQSKGHWLLNDTLKLCYIHESKIQEDEIDFVTFGNLMEKRWK